MGSEDRPTSTPPTGDPAQRSWLSEVRRRRVHRVVIAYAAAAFVALQGAELLMEGLGVGRWLFQTVLIAALVGLPIAIVVGWLYDFERGTLRRTDESPSAPPLPAARFAGLVGVALVLGTLFWWLRPSPVQGNVVEGADVIAVLPFRASGPGSEGLGEGMVDLLSTNLDEVGDIRTVDPARVLNAARNAGALADDEATRLGRELGARSVLSGALNIAGGTARVTAVLRSTADGTTLAETSVDGSESDLFSLVDSLSVELLRQVWRARAPMPALELEAVTTGHPGALRAYLRGEALKRQALWDEAEIHLREAVVLDSTFALAAASLSAVIGWQSGTDPESGRMRALAARHGDRLPQRLRRLNGAVENWQSGRLLEAQDTLRAILSADPQDHQAWFLLGEVWYHGRGFGPFSGMPADSILRAFERSAAVVPDDASALLHPISIAMAELRREDFERYLARLSDLLPAPTVAAIAAAGRYLFDGEGSGGAALVGLARHQTVLTGDFILGAVEHPDRDPHPIADSVLALVDGGRIEAPPTTVAPIVGLFLAIGRLSDARTIVETAGSSPEQVATVWVGPFSLGLFDIDRLAPSVTAGMDDPGADFIMRLIESLHGLHRGDPQAAERFVETPPADLPASLEPVSAVLDGWTQALRGDTVGGLGRMRGALERFDEVGAQVPVDILEIGVLALEATRPATAEAVLATLAERTWIGPFFTLPTLMVEGDALRTLGRTDEARRRYRRVVDLLERADPDTRWLREQARARLEAL